MLYQTSFGLQNLHSKNLAHGDLRPQLIGYDKSLNQYQILDRFADPTPLERCQTNNIVNKKDLYLSPQLYQKLKGADKRATYNNQKNDIYSFGLSLLHAGVQDSVQDIYLPNGSINRNRLDEHLQKFESKHNQRNPLLYQAVRQLLSEDEAQRPDVNQLLANLPPYDHFKHLEAQNRPFDNSRPQERNELSLEQKHIENLNLFNLNYILGGKK
jgi:serine/threonine protein kinase